MDARHLDVTSTVSSLKEEKEEEEKEEVPDLQQSFYFGNSVVKPQTSLLLLEDAEQQELPKHYSTETVYLSRTQLKHVVESVLKNSLLKYLYLEGNQISSIPDSMFTSLPNLLWLDLRNNQITFLPAKIGLHRSLKTVLLEGNPISELPPELGNVITLKGLNLRNCPICFPPQHIVSQGLWSILQYLRSAMAVRPGNARKSPSELPVVEKLQLSELMGSSVEESVDEDELRRFRDLRHRMILLDKAELGSLPPADEDLKSRLLPAIKRKKATTQTGAIPQLPLFDSRHWKKKGLEERRQAAIKELTEKQAILEQRRKKKSSLHVEECIPHFENQPMSTMSQEALRKWGTQAKILQENITSGRKKHAEQRNQEEAETDSKPGVGQASTLSIPDCEDTRSARKLERQIRDRVNKMQERHRNSKATTTEQMAASEIDVEEIRKLQTRLLERKRNWGGDFEKCFTIFTEDTWPSFIHK